MIQIAIVLGGSALLVYALFVRARQPDAILSSWRWMLSTWGLLTLFGLTSPVSYDRMSTDPWTVVYLVLWVASYVLGDVWAYRRATARHPLAPPERPGPVPAAPDAQEAQPGAAEPLLFHLLIALSVVGAAGFGYLMLSSVGADDSVGLLAELRDLQVAGEVSSPGATVLQLMAFSGLPVALILIANAIRRGLPVPLLVWLGIMSSASVYMTTAGRQGLVITSFACIATVVSSFALGKAPYAHRRSLFAPLAGVLLIFAGYFVYNVATRGTVDGDMDIKLEMIERVYGAYVDPGFRESVRPLGSLGDTACELYLYLGTQLPGLSALLREYRVGLDFGIGLVPYFTRRLESLLGLNLLDPIYNGQKDVFLNMGMPGNFFLTAAGSTFESFGTWGGLLVVWAAGAVAGWHRRRVQRAPTGQGLAVQAMLCAGAAFTIIFSPTIEAGWAFPMLWLLVIAWLGRSRRPSPTAATSGASPSVPT